MLSLKSLNIPVLGYANAGEPRKVAQEEYLGELNLDINMIKVKKDLFALVLSGDSMNMKVINGKSMDDGSYVVIAKDSEIQDGDTVVAIIDGAATVKTYRSTGNETYLYPESSNSMHKPIRVDIDSEMHINGKVIQVVQP